MTASVIGIVPGSRSGNINKDHVRNFKYVLQVVTNNIADGVQIVGDAIGVPRIYQQYSLGNDNDTAALCISKDVKEISPITNDDGTKGNLWHVALEFDSSAIERKENPLEEPVRYSLNWANYDRLVEKDLDGKPLANVLGDLFVNPPHTQQESNPILVARFNVATINVPFVLDYRDAINADEYQGAPPGYAKLINIQTGEIQSRNAIEFYGMTFEIQFKDPDGDPWDPKILNRGKRFKVLDNNTPVNFPDGELHNLDSQGFPLATDAKPHYLDFKTHRRRPFSALGI